MHYALTHSGTYKDLRVLVYAERSHAEASILATTAPDSEVVSSALDLGGRPGPKIVMLYNALLPEGEKPISKFETRTIGAERTFRALEVKYGNAPAEPAPPAVSDPADSSNQPNDEDDMTKKTKTKAPKKVKAAKGPKAPRKPASAKLPKAETDKFGLRKGTKASESAAMFAKAAGSTMAKVKEATGDTCYNLLNKLKERGHKVKKDGETFFLTAKGE